MQRLEPQMIFRLRIFCIWEALFFSWGKEIKTLYHTLPSFNNPKRKKALEKTAGEGENAGNQHNFYFIIDRIHHAAIFNSSSTNIYHFVLSGNFLFGKKVKQKITRSCIKKKHYPAAKLKLKAQVERLRYPDPEGWFFKSCYLSYFRCTKGNNSHYFGND